MPCGGWCGWLAVWVGGGFANLFRTGYYPPLPLARHDPSRPETHTKRTKKNKTNTTTQKEITIQKAKTNTNKRTGQVPTHGRAVRVAQVEGGGVVRLLHLMLLLLCL